LSDISILFDERKKRKRKEERRIKVQEDKKGSTAHKLYQV